MISIQWARNSQYTQALVDQLDTLDDADKSTLLNSTAPQRRHVMISVADRIFGQRYNQDLVKRAASVDRRVMSLFKEYKLFVTMFNAAADREKDPMLRKLFFLD